LAPEVASEPAPKAMVRDPASVDFAPPEWREAEQRAAAQTQTRRETEAQARQDAQQRATAEAQAGGVAEPRAETQARGRRQAEQELAQLRAQLAGRRPEP